MDERMNGVIIKFPVERTRQTVDSAMRRFEQAYAEEQRRLCSSCEGTGYITSVMSGRRYICRRCDIQVRR